MPRHEGDAQHPLRDPKRDSKGELLNHLYVLQDTSIDASRYRCGYTQGLYKDAKDVRRPGPHLTEDPTYQLGYKDGEGDLAILDILSDS